MEEPDSQQIYHAPSGGTGKTLSYTGSTPTTYIREKVAALLTAHVTSGVTVYAYWQTGLEFLVQPCNRSEEEPVSKPWATETQPSRRCRKSGMSSQSTRSTYFTTTQRNETLKLTKSSIAFSTIEINLKRITASRLNTHLESWIRHLTK